MVERLGRAHARDRADHAGEGADAAHRAGGRRRGARRQAELVAQQLRGWPSGGVPLSPLQVAENVSAIEEYRWVASFLSWVEKS